MKKLISDLKANTNEIRKQALIALVTVVGAVIAGIVITKLDDDNTPVLILSETPVPLAEAEVQTEF